MAAAVPPVIIKATKKHTATLIFLHGLGDTGVGWAGALNSMKLSNMKIICPTAPMIPVSLNMGMQMPAWYDIYTLDAENPDKREDIEGVEMASQNLEGLVSGEVQGGIPRSSVFVGGFSQGGAVALYHTLRHSDAPVGGCIALSTYIPGNMRWEGSDRVSSCTTPILQVHGEADDVVKFERGKQTLEILKKYAKEIQWKSYPGMGHEGTLEELELVKDFILKNSNSDNKL